MRAIGKRAIGLLLPLALLAAPAPVHAAAVKPLEVVTEKILVLETERLAHEHALTSALVRRNLERLDRQMNIMSQERTADSLRLLADTRESLRAAMRSAAALSGYVKDVASQMQTQGHGRFIPLAKLNDAVEKPYHAALERFLATATDFVQFCHDNLEAIATGQPQETKRYDNYYAAYLKAMDEFNSRRMKRSQELVDWSADYPALLEYLPR
jgi:hypothetical protein